MRKSTTDEQSPAFQFYANDWISDPNRLKLNLEEQGAYILLYCHCWRGFRIEYDLEILSKMCNCRLDKIKIIFPKIEHLFYKEKDKNGKTCLICKQAEEERKEQKLNRKRRSIAGKWGLKKDGQKKVWRKMKTLVIILLGVKLNYVNYPMKFEDCFDSFMYTVEKIAKYQNQTNDTNQGYYTKKGRLVVGHYCK